MRQQTGVSKRVKPHTWTGAKARPDELGRWIELANIAVGEVLPEIPSPIARSPDSSEVSGVHGGVFLTWARELDYLQELPPNVGTRLVEASKAKVTDAIRNRYPAAHFLRDDDLFWRKVLMTDAYNEIRAANLLHQIAMRGKADREPLERFFSVLRKTDLNYLRVCRIDECKAIFYADKSRQPGCTPEHSAKFRRRRQYALDKARRHPNPRVLEEAKERWA